jgi:hypothetical protein
MNDPCCPSTGLSISNLSEARESSLPRISTDSTRSIRASSPARFEKRNGAEISNWPIVDVQFQDIAPVHEAGYSSEARVPGEVELMLGINLWYIDGSDI